MQTTLARRCFSTRSNTRSNIKMTTRPIKQPIKRLNTKLTIRQTVRPPVRPNIKHNVAPTVRPGMKYSVIHQTRSFMTGMTYKPLVCTLKNSKKAASFFTQTPVPTTKMVELNTKNIVTIDRIALSIKSEIHINSNEICKAGFITIEHLARNVLKDYVNSRSFNELITHADDINNVITHSLNIAIRKNNIRISRFEVKAIAYDTDAQAVLDKEGTRAVTIVLITVTLCFILSMSPYWAT